MEQIQADFDRIALLPEDGWNHNNHYHSYLLQYIPQPCREALEIGCGNGAFSRLLAGKVDQVTSLDLSPNMIRLARERSTGFFNIQYEVADATLWEAAPGRFDCIVSLATFHHLPFGVMLERARRWLRVGGVLILLDLYRTNGLMDLGRDLAAVPVNLVMKLWKDHRLTDPPASRQAWAEHTRRDVLQTLAQIRTQSTPILPGTHIRRHLFWRYSLIWEKKDD